MMDKTEETPLADAPWLQSDTSRRLMDVLTAGNMTARFVGGCVRDALLGHMDPHVDLDVATPLLPNQVTERLEAAGMKAIPTGLAHGTVTALVDERRFEITTLRRDIACDGRHADIAFTDDFKLDAERRDFTVNAMSTDRQGRLFDYFGGVVDLKAGRIRFVGEARTRVREDYLRILRFFRFFARYGRPPADRQAVTACREEASGLTHISGERIRSEMLKLLASDNPIGALNLMIESEVLYKVLPLDVDLALLRRLMEAVPDSDPLLRLAALLRSVPEGCVGTDAVTAWKLSNAALARLERLTQEPLLTLPLTENDAMRALYQRGHDLYLDLLKLSAPSTAAFDAALPVPMIHPFPVTGQDLIDRQVRPGPELGKRLKQLEDWWLSNDLRPDRQACLQELDQRLANP